ncbi:MAG: DVU_1557 family redox protein [Acetobacterium sp.]
MNIENGKDTPWVCGKCHNKLELKKVTVLYLAGSFEVELMKCPVCNYVLITEELAMGKMLEVEEGLENK